MKSDDILDAVGEIDGKKVARAHAGGQRTVHPWRRWAAAAAALLLVAGGVFAAVRMGGKAPAGETEPPVPTPTQSQSLPGPGMGGSPALLAAAVYPEMPQHPRDYNDNAAMQSWYESVRAQQMQRKEYSGALDGYLRRSLPKLLAGAAGENRVCSPLNVYLALAMLSEAAGGESRAQLLELLGADSLETLRARAKAVWNANYQDDGTTRSILSSSLWLDEDVDFVQETLDTLAADYYASSYRGQAGSADYDRMLQAWLNEHTGGLLEAYVNDIELDDDTLLALVTAVDFYASWIQEFRAEQNETGVFHALDGDLEAEFMRETRWANYYWGERFSAVQKELELGLIPGNMWLLLPDEGVSPEALLEDEEVLNFLLTDKDRYRADGSPAWENSAFVELHLSLPKFDVAAKTDLIGSLQALGVTDIFEPGQADFSPTVQNQEDLLPYIAKAEHAARVSIDETGVTGAAYTVVEMRAGGAPVMPEDQVDFVLDRPFLFAVTGADGLPLFVGIVQTP